MKKIVTAISLIASQIFFAQSTNPEIKTNLPQIIPPSPTVASLMKFEEVPVNNYTGVPDISLPLISVPTHSKDINLDISLKYHPGNVKAENVAGDVGLGWNILTGGVISRTIKGLPDEELRVASTSALSRVGIYQNSIQNFKNIYYQFEQDPVGFETNNTEIANEYYWETVENGKYDTEHDVWQFNFLGNSGKFYIKKNLNGTLEVEPLSDYRVKIINNYSTVNNQDYTPTGFTVYDEKGYRYIFDVFEITARSTDTQSLTRVSQQYVTSTGHSEERPYRSSFHLTKIFDPNNTIVFSIEYDERDLKEAYTQSNLTVADFGVYVDNVLAGNCWGEFPPLRQNTVSINSTSVKKIKSIVIPNFGKVEFDYSIGRLDTNTTANANYLHQIKLLNSNNEMIKQYSFDYDYNSSIYTRMFLKTITKSTPNNAQPETHEFFYKHNLEPSMILSKDAWGYFNTFNLENCIAQDITFMREASPQVSTLDLLQKIKYPTGGCAIFSFEANEFSFVGDQPILDYASYSSNYSLLSTDSYYFNNNQLQYIPVSSENRKAVMFTSIVLPDDPNTWNRNISLIKIVNGQQTVVGGLFCTESNANCCYGALLEKNTVYAFRRNNFNINYQGTDDLTIKYYGIDSNKKFTYGGGNRIAKIAYFSKDVSQYFYEQSTGDVPAKEKIFSYKMPDDNNKSSGSLAFSIPRFKEERLVNVQSNCAVFPYCASTNGNTGYSTESVYSGQQIVDTQGADVGYKFVKVFETGKGTIEEEFTSPLDYPEMELITYQKPYLPSKNIDYKRGLLLNQKIKGNDGKLLSFVTNTYTFVEFEKLYGYRFNKPDGVAFQGRFSGNHSYATFKTVNNPNVPSVLSDLGPSCLDHFVLVPNSFPAYTLGTPIEDIDFYPLHQIYGWPKLASKKTINYFYENGGTKNVEKEEFFEYNPLNKKISQYTEKHKEGTEYVTKYFYHSGNSAYSDNRISEIEKIESYKNGKLLDTKKIIYNNTWNGNISYLPGQVQSSMGNQSLETQVTYDQYDSKGNIQQYTTKDGVSTTIIWGYNQTQPIAKIEGAKLSDISQSLIENIVSASNTDAAAASGNDETAFLSALNTFRTNTSLSWYQITTYTYDPLVGVRSITPPSGIREVYLYDSANRLKEVREQNQTGKLVKEYQYNYKH